MLRIVNDPWKIDTGIQFWLSNMMCLFSECPEHGTIVNDKYCITANRAEITWQEAREKCEEMGGDLLQMQTKEKFDSITSKGIIYLGRFNSKACFFTA